MANERAKETHSTKRSILLLLTTNSTVFWTMTEPAQNWRLSDPQTGQTSIIILTSTVAVPACRSTVILTPFMSIPTDRNYPPPEAPVLCTHPSPEAPMLWARRPPGVEFLRTLPRSESKVQFPPPPEVVWAHNLSTHWARFKQLEKKTDFLIRLKNQNLNA